MILTATLTRTFPSRCLGLEHLRIVVYNSHLILHYYSLNLDLSFLRCNREIYLFSPWGDLSYFTYWQSLYSSPLFIYTMFIIVIILFLYKILVAKLPSPLNLLWKNFWYIALGYSIRQFWGNFGTFLSNKINKMYLGSLWAKKLK